MFNAHLGDGEPVGRVSVGVPGVHLQRDLVLPAELLHLLPGRVRARQQELHTHARHETLRGDNEGGYLDTLWV